MFRGPRFTLWYNELNEQISVILAYSLDRPNRLEVEFKVKTTGFNKDIELSDFTLSKLMAYHRYASGNQTFMVFEKSRMHISFFDVGKSSAEMQMQTRTIDFAEFFNCPRRLETVNDLKGISYSAATSSFFIFIHFRSYLEIKEDLIVRFSLSDEHYERARQLDFPLDHPGFINLDLKRFIKVLGSDTYFIALDRIYQLDDANERLEMKWIEKPSEQLEDLRRCEYSTFDFPTLFCFAPDSYKPIVNRTLPDPISYTKMFDGTAVHLSKDDRVLMVFRHRRYFILMTQTHYFNLSEDIVRVDNESDSWISFAPTKGEAIRKYEHDLFKLVKQQSRSPNKTERGGFLLLVLLVTPLIAFALLIAYLRRSPITPINLKLGRVTPEQSTKKGGLKNIWTSIHTSLTSPVRRPKRPDRWKKLTRKRPDIKSSSDICDVQLTRNKKSDTKPSSETCDMQLARTKKSDSKVTSEICDVQLTGIYSDHR